MKNKSLIMSIVTAAAGLLGLVFLALPFVPRTSGYNFFELLQYVGEMPFDYALLYLAPLFMFITSLLLLGFGIVNILGATKVIKNEKFVKVSKIIALVAASVFVLFAVFAFIWLIVKGNSIGAGLVLLLVVALAALVASILDLVWRKK